MGLDTTHDCFHGAYSAFTRFRIALADAAGYPRDPEAPSAAPFWTDELDRMANDDNLMGRWDAPPEDALLVLLLHSDCDGEIPPQLCGPLADRIEGLIPALEGKNGGGHLGWIADRARQFVAGLREAASAGEAVLFR